MRTAQIIITSCNRRELEIEHMRRFLRGNGHRVSDDDWSVDRSADLVFLSTCGFTQAAEDFGFETLHRINRQKAPSAEVVMCGCIPAINPRRVKNEFGGRTFTPQSYSALDGIIHATHSFHEFSRPNTVTLPVQNPLHNHSRASRAQRVPAQSLEVVGIDGLTR